MGRDRTALNKVPQSKSLGIQRTIWEHIIPGVWMGECVVGWGLGDVRNIRDRKKKCLGVKTITAWFCYGLALMGKKSSILCKTN